MGRTASSRPASPVDPYAPIGAGLVGPDGDPHGPGVVAIEVGTPEYDRITSTLRGLRRDGVAQDSPEGRAAIESARDGAVVLMARRGKFPLKEEMK
ncbi:MAG: hypothetical protein L0H79_21470 [Intrasporangium sp.]|uniref:hypothetical protein n=1 Tax=Intrasporangium sp. TaxID=1925024 RepID=UPI002647CC4C|nr:hypothetical protein [Intrasporangium sp.]MDN5798298.1 hypothetical protein [Intrasporangium sp.]